MFCTLDRVNEWWCLQVTIMWTDYLRSFCNNEGEPVIRQYPRGRGSSAHHKGRSDDDGFYGDRSRGGRCGGLCVLPNHCASLKGTAKGFCSPSGQDSRVCCSCKLSYAQFLWILSAFLSETRVMILFCSSRQIVRRVNEWIELDVFFARVS